MKKAAEVRSYRVDLAGAKFGCEQPFRTPPASGTYEPWEECGVSVAANNMPMRAS